MRADRDARELGAVLHLLGRERVQVEIGRGPLERADEILVEATLDAGREARLDSDLRRAERARLERTPDDLVLAEEVRLLRSLEPRERAEVTRLHARVREVDVAVDDVGDHIAGLPAPHLVGRCAQRLEVRAARGREDHRALDRELTVAETLLEDGARGTRGGGEREVERGARRERRHAPSPPSSRSIAARDGCTSAASTKPSRVR